MRDVLQGLLESVALLAILAIILYARGRRVLQRRAWKRTGHGFPEFAAYFEYSDVPEVQRRVFEYVQQNWAIEILDFPVHADDSIDVYAPRRRSTGGYDLRFGRSVRQTEAVNEYLEGTSHQKCRGSRPPHRAPADDGAGRIEGGRRHWTDQ